MLFIPKFLFKDSCVVKLYNGTDEDGAPIELEPKKLICFYQDTKAMRIRGAQIISDDATAELIFEGDIAPELTKIADGEVEIFGEGREISSGQKNYYDGEVLYTRLLIK